MADPKLGVYNIADLRELARRRMPKAVFDYVDRGAEDEVSMRNNRAALESIRFRPRLLVDVSKRDISTTIFGRKIKMPVAVGPTGFGGLCAYEGEVLIAKAAAAAGVPYALGAGVVTSMDKVMAQGGHDNLWFQISMWPDRQLCKAMVDRAREAGFQALIVTVDGPVVPNREFNLRAGFNTPFNVTPRSVAKILYPPHWLFKVIFAYYLKNGGMPSHDNYPHELRRKITDAPTAKGRIREKIDSLTWEDLREVRKIWPHPLIVKGVLSAREAKLAADSGADGVIISNHGGRTLDGAVTPIEVLPNVVDEVGHRMTVMIDSGFRRGSDVVKALALGAKLVLLGRPPLYGVSAAGEAGVARALAIFREEIDRVIALLGCTSLAELTPELLSLPGDPDYNIRRPMRTVRQGDLDGAVAGEGVRDEQGVGAAAPEGLRKSATLV